MEREKDNIIIIADEDDAAAETAKASDGGRTDTTTAENDSAETKKRTTPDFLRSFASGIRGAAGKRAKNIKAISGGLSPRLVTISCIASAAVIIAAALTAFLIPKSDSATERALGSLRESDVAYLEAKQAYDDALDENKRLNEDLAEKNDELEVFRSARGGLDKINDSNAELEKTRDDLLKEAEEKQKEYNSLASSAPNAQRSIVTLPSGYYTAGKDIAAGKYTVTGSGSIAVARDGTSTANKLLTSEGGEFEFEDGDRIQIDGSAKFVPR